MPINTNKTVSVDLLCDNTLCKKRETMSQEETKLSTWVFFRKGNAQNLFLYEKVDQFAKRKVFTTSVRISNEVQAVFCCSACAGSVMKQELEKFLYNPMQRDGDRIKLSTRIY